MMVTMLARVKTTPFNMVASMREDQGKVLRILRAANDWSMDEAAAAVGVSRQTWYTWERGKSEMRMAHLRIILKMWESAFGEAAA